MAQRHHPGQPRQRPATAAGLPPYAATAAADLSADHPAAGRNWKEPKVLPKVSHRIGKTRGFRHFSIMIGSRTSDAVT